MKKKYDSPEFCEVCFEVSSDLLHGEDASEWICIECSKDMMNERRIYEDQTRYAHEYYMGNCDPDDERDQDDEEII